MFAEFGKHNLKKLQAVLNECIVWYCEDLHGILDDVAEKLVKF